MNYLIHGNMTLYYRTLWPVARRLIENDHNVFFIRREGFSESYVKKNPTNVSFLDENALKFICDNVGYDYSYIDRINWIEQDGHRKHNRFIHGILSRIKTEKFNGFVSTTKDFGWLNSKWQNNIPQIALPYQNILDGYSFCREKNLPDKSNADVDYYLSLRSKYPNNYIPIGLPFVDTLVHKKIDHPINEHNKAVMLLHDGGYRNVISSARDDEKTCILKQRELYESLLNSIPDSHKLLVKIHPLAAEYNDYETNYDICQDLGIKVVKGWLGKYCFECDHILSLGSSSYFELAGLGIPFWILGFIGGERIEHYQKLKSRYIMSYEQLFNKLNDPCPIDEKKYCDWWFNLCDGNATKRSIELIEHSNYKSII